MNEKKKKEKKKKKKNAGVIKIYDKESFSCHKTLTIYCYNCHVTAYTCVSCDFLRHKFQLNIMGLYHT